MPRVTVSVDGLRRSIAKSFNKLVEIRLEFVKDRDGLDYDEAETLRDLRQDLATLMLLYSEDPADLMSELDPDQLLVEIPDEA